MRSDWRHLGAGMVCAAAILLDASSQCALPPKSEPSPLRLPPAEGKRVARELVNNLLSTKPTENMTEMLLFKITDPDDKERQVSVRFQIICTPTNFLNVYETMGEGGSSGGMRLSIVHSGDAPNEYLLSQPPQAPPKKLTGKELTLPFAGSDFWVSDLGLEFLHWGEQRVTRKEMRRSVFCDVLESTNPHPSPGDYTKVVSWIGANRPDELVLVRANALDSKGRLLKWFEPTKLQKVNGVQELKEMELRNRQTGSSTKIEFNLNQRKVEPGASQ